MGFPRNRNADASGHGRRSLILMAAIASTLALPASAAQLPPGTLLIAPHIMGASYCPAAASDPKIMTDEQADAVCAKAGANAAARIIPALDAIGPIFSPSHKYALGYVLDVPLLRYVSGHSGNWEVDAHALQTTINTIAEVNRPVVVYLSLNHFAEVATQVATELAKDDRNLMYTPRGPLRGNSYYVVSVHAWTLANKDAPITKLREQLFGAATKAICNLNAKARERISAISLLGEVHQLFPDLMHGVGYQSPIEETDYSPASTNGFRTWLRARYPSIADLNAAVGGHFSSFDKVNPPARDAIQRGGDPLTHLDASASGKLAVYGWLYDPSGKIPTVNLYIDGRQVAQEPADLNRTDVPQADPSVNTPNVGWHFDYDYTALSLGAHILELSTKTADGHIVRFGERRFFVTGSRRPGVAIGPETVAIPVGSLSNAGLRLAVDGPTPELKVLYDPLAKLWLEYRNVQVRQYYEMFAGILEHSCVPRNLVFSHQITPQLNATWNPDLMAVSASQAPDPLYLPGATLYGGAAFGQAFLRFKQQDGWGQYGVSELHPQFHLSRDRMEAMFEQHRVNGARFVAPYFISILPDRVKPADNDLIRLKISPNNPHAELGSSALYAAMVDIMHTK